MSDRKYGHKGYRSSDGERTERPPRPRPQGPPPDRTLRPRGRGLGAPTEAVFRCARCGQASPVADAAGFEARCPACGTDLHSCANCSAFDPAARFQCRHPLEERVAPKDRANRCELFAPRTRQEFAEEKRQPGDARSAFDALFKI